MTAPLRVAFLLPHFRPGGAERVVLNWIGALDRDRFAPVLLLGEIDGAFRDLLPADVTPVALGGRALTRPRRIAHALAAQRIDVAYSATNAMNLALLAAPSRVAKIVSEHTPPRAYLAEAKLALPRRLAMRTLYPSAAAVAVPTERIAAELKALLGPRIRTEILPNPVIATIPPLPSLRAAGRGPRIVSAGRLVPAKGFDLLIDAAALLASRGLVFVLDIYGDGPERDALAQRIAGHGLSRWVTLRGNSDALADRIAEADLFVLASRREGFGNVLIEAMAVGTPVLATRAGGPETFLREGENGFLAPTGDAPALALAIAALATEPERRIAVRAAAQDTARDYLIEASTARFADLARRLAGARSTPA